MNLVFQRLEEVVISPRLELQVVLGYHVGAER